MSEEGSPIGSSRSISGGAAVEPRPLARREVPQAISNEARFAAVFHAHYDFVWRSLRRLGVHPDAVDDAAQDVFVVVLRKIEAIRPGAERSFLFGTALRVAKDVRRAGSRRREHLTDRDAIGRIEDPIPTPDDLMDQKRARELLDRILDEMPLDRRAVFILYELEELTTKEIAECLDLPVGTVASRLRRAREWFHERVEGHSPNGDQRP